MGSQIRYFQPTSEDGSAEWHAYRDESAQALCGEATLSYNRDKVADSVPSDGSLHDGCRQAIDAENPAPYTPHPDDAVTEETEATASDETDGGETPTTPSTEADPGGGETQPAPSTPDGSETETQEVTSGDVAPLSSVVGEGEPTPPPAPAPEGDQPPADQPPADQPPA